MPAEIVARLVAALNDASAAPDLRERLLPLGMVPRPDTPQAFTEELKAQDRRYAGLVKELGLRMD